MKNKFSLLLLAVLAALLAITYSYTLDTKLDLNGDNATYIALARNMASGMGYAQSGINGVQPANHFPPGYSAILSVFIWLGIDNLLFFKVLNAIFLYLSLALLYLAFSGATRQRWLTAATVLLLCCSTQLLHFAGMAMSEMSYMCCMCLSVFALWMYADNNSANNGWTFLRSPWFWVAILGAMASYHIRSVGMAMVISLVLFFLFRREWWAALTAAASEFVLMLPWMLRNKFYGLESRYFGTVMTVNPWRPEEGNISSVGEFIEKMITNIDQTVIQGFPAVLFPFANIEHPEPSGWLGIVFGLVVLGIVFYGAWKTGALRWVLIFLMLGNIGLFALWHGGNGTRYVTPIIPFVYLLFYNGIFSLIRLAARGRIPEHSWLGLAVLLMILPMIKPLQNMHKQSAMPYHPAYTNYFRIATEMNKKLPKGTVVCCRKPELFRFYAPKLYTTYYRYDTQPDSVIAAMVRQQVDYVVVEQLGYGSTPRYLIPAIQARSQLFPVAWHLPNPDTYLLRFQREKAAEILQINN